MDDVFEAALDESNSLHRRAKAAAQVLYDPIISWIRHDLKIEVMEPVFRFDSKASAIRITVAKVPKQDLSIWGATGNPYGNIFTNLDPDFSGHNRYRFGARADVAYNISVNQSGTKAAITGYISIYPYLARQRPGAAGFDPVEWFNSGCVEVLRDVLWDGHVEYFNVGRLRVLELWEEL